MASAPAIANTTTGAECDIGAGAGGAAGQGRVPWPTAPPQFRLAVLTRLGQGPQPAVRAVEDVLVSGQAAPGRVLPEGVETPAAWQPAAAASRVVGDPQRVPLAETGRVPGARGPPVGGGVDHGIRVLLVGVLLNEVLDPRVHLVVRQPVALAAVGVVLDVERARQGHSVGGPAAAVADEVPGLGLTAGIVRDSKVVCPPDNPVIVRPDILIIENRIRVVI